MFHACDQRFDGMDMDENFLSEKILTNLVPSMVNFQRKKKDIII